MDVRTCSSYKDDGTSGVAFVKSFHVIVFGLQMKISLTDQVCECKYFNFRNDEVRPQCVLSTGQLCVDSRGILACEELNMAQWFWLSGSSVNHKVGLILRSCVHEQGTANCW